MINQDFVNMFAQRARHIAQHSCCPRAAVGAVICDAHGRFLGEGCNMAHYGMPDDYTCTNEAHTMIDGHCEATLHAEQHAILNAYKNGNNLCGAIMVVTHSPCIHCAKLIMAAGISTIYIGELYRHNPVIGQWFEHYGMEAFTFSGDILHL